MDDFGYCRHIREPPLPEGRGFSNDPEAVRIMMTSKPELEVVTKGMLFDGPFRTVDTVGIASDNSNPSNGSVLFCPKTQIKHSVADRFNFKAANPCTRHLVLATCNRVNSGCQRAPALSSYSISERGTRQFTSRLKP